MALYSTNNKANATPARVNLATTAVSQLSLTAATATLRRAFIYEFDVGADGTPNATDCAIMWDLSKQTSLGTGVAMTINPLDQSDAATGSVGTANYTIEPIVASPTTGVASLWVLAANQRASYRWVVNPGGPGEMVIPAINVTGLVIRALSPTYASTVITTMLFRE